MVGSASAVLEGYSSPVVPGVDHTFVVSSCGLQWPCFGQSNKGTLISSGFGNSFEADCRSYPEGWRVFPRGTFALYAGVTYSVDGVCHQASNRILYGAGVTVAGAPGFPASSRVFGVYGGVDPLPEMASCVGANTIRAGARVSFTKLVKLGVPLQVSGSDSRSAQMKSYDSTATATASVPDSIDELAAFLELKLSHAVNHDLLHGLFDAQCELRRKRRSLVRGLENGELSKTQYLPELDAAFVTFMNESMKILGKEEFIRVYGDGPRDLRGIIDPQIFLAESAQTPR
jgi:hypothetical protein